jgi:membrane peptidoglycan carboxypeptidase
MQTALQRRQRHRRAGAARRGRGGGAGRRAALAIPLLLFSSFLVLGGVGFVGSVSAYAYYARDLPDPKTAFDTLKFDQPTLVYDRTGQVQLASFGERNRELVTFDEVPAEIIDATTAIEDKDFWSNPGFDIGGFVSATIDTLTGHPRGGSTITQQLVRDRLLPAEAFSGSVYDRKIREIIQSIRLTQAFPGEDGKKQIITAYLNQNFYGNQSYGIKAAAVGYFNKQMAELTLAQDALLAAIPKSPTQYDLVRNAITECSVTVPEGQDCPADKVQLVVPSTSPVVVRRNNVLALMKTRSVLSGSNHTIQDYDAAINEPVVLTPQTAPPWKAPHLVWQVRRQLGAVLCGPDAADSCEKLDTGGYKVITTLDWKMQQSVDKWVYIAARVPQAKSVTATKAILKSLGVPSSDWGWVVNLRGKGIGNAAGAVIDYRTGQVLAVAGSAGYYLQSTDPKFSPQYDVMFDGYRQPGSSIKPLNYITGIDDHTINASTLFMDVVTEFEKGWTPAEADDLERGPVRMRSALQFSLNIPSIKASFINGLSHVFERYQAFGLQFPTGTVPVASEGIGTLDIHMIDLLSAYGSIANSGTLMQRQLVLEVDDPTGQAIYPTPADVPVGSRVASPQASYIINNILEGNTIKSVNGSWAAWAIKSGGKRRPAAYKTGTTDQRKDIDAFGYLPPPTDPALPALAVGVWMGNSDATELRQKVTSVASSAALWNHIMTDVSKGLPIVEFKRPSGLVSVTVDGWSGLLPGPGTISTVKEIYIKGTQPTRVDNMHVQVQIDAATGLLWQDGCTGPAETGWYLDFSQVEPGFPRWQPFTQEWAARAAKGPGVAGGPKGTRTTYFFDGFLVPFGRTWGGKFAPKDVCQPVTQCNGNGGGGGGPGPLPTPCPTPGPSGSPGPSPSHGKATPVPTVPIATAGPVPP